MKTIYVESEELDATASKMEDANNSYQHNCNLLFQTVESLKNSWQGKDNIAFSMQIQKYESDFKELSILCTQYIEFLRHSAAAYREMQEDLAAQASHLS